MVSDSIGYDILLCSGSNMKAMTFDARQMGEPKLQYIGWLDVMGSQDILSRSTKVASNFIMKLHISALEALETQPTVELYPVMDGLYCSAATQGEIFRFLKVLYIKLAEIFNSENRNLYKFVVRGGLAYGPIVSGNEISAASETLLNNQDYCKKILLGIALIQAFQTEKVAPPFGLRLHESVRAFAPPNSTPLSVVFWKWWKMEATEGEETVAMRLKDNLMTYYQWCEKHTTMLNYSSEKIASHRLLAAEYFSEE